MKIIFFLFLPFLSYSQQYFCEHKLTEFAEWRSGNPAVVIIDSAVIKIIERPGIVSNIEYDTILDLNPSTMYTYENSVRVTVMDQESRYLISVLNNHYLCKKNNN